MTTGLYVGLMSGTSLDGVDGVLAAIGLAACGQQAIDVIAHHHAPIPQGLRECLLQLNTRGDDELHRAALAGNALMRVYARVVNGLLHDALLKG